MVSKKDKSEAAAKAAEKPAESAPVATAPTAPVVAATTIAPAPESPPAIVEPKALGAEKALATRLRQGYERFAERVGVELRERGRIGKKQWEGALDRARDFVRRSKPELKREDVEKVAEGVKKDAAHAVTTIRARGDDFTRSVAFLTARDKGAQFLLKIAHLVKDVALKAENNLEDVLRYRKGDVAGSGQFVCVKCQEPVALAQSGPVPACPKCAHEELRRKA